MDNNINQGADNRPRYFDHNSQQNGDDQQGMRPKLDAFQNIKHNPPQPPIGHQRNLQRIPQRTASHSVSYSDASNLDTMKRRYSIENVVLTNLPNYASDQQQQQQYLSSALLSPPLTSPFSTDSLLSFFPQQQQLSQVSQMRPAQYYSNQEQSFLFSSSSASSSPSSSSSPPEATMRLIRKQQQQQQQQQQSQHLLHPVIESRSQSPMFDDGGGGASRSYINASAALNESDLLLQQQQQNQQQRNQLFDTAAEFERILLEQRINSLLNFVPQNGQMQFGEIGSSYNKQFGNHLGYNHAKSRMRAVSTGSTDIIETLMAAAAAATVKSNPRSVQQQPIGTHFNSGNIKSRSAATSISSMFDNTTTTTTTAAGSPSTSALLSPLMISPNNQFNQPLLSPPVPKMVQVQLTEEEEKLAQSGSIFERRTDWSSLLSRLPISKQNAIHLRIEDDGPYGNDETRLFLLSHFSALRLKEIPCVMCSCVLVIYDRFPIVDGTLFTSPVMYDKEKSISGGSQYKGQYIHAICLKCLLGEDNHEIKCRSCQNRLNPDHIQIGTLYKFDLFAAFACCPSRLTCKACMQPLHVDEDSMSFSSYSDERQCPKCKKRTHHFIKPLNDIFLPSKCASSCSKSHQMTPHLESIADF